MEKLCDLRIGQEVEVEELGLRLRLDSVDDDSRCPVGVNCIWDGNVRILLSLSLDETTCEQTPLNSALEPQAIMLGERQITISKVTPPRIVGATIKSGDYVITLAVSAEVRGDSAEEQTRRHD